MSANLILGHQADGTLTIIRVDSDGHLQVDGLTVALPTGAATEAKQDTMITALQLIDDLRAALGSVNTDDLQVDVKTSALPTGAATEAKQDTQITALQLIDDLRNALASVATDRLRMAEMRERNGSNISLTYRAGGVAPHADTQRWTYTVAASKVLLVERTHLAILRDAVATTAGYVTAYLLVTPSGGSGNFIDEVILWNLAVGATLISSVGQSLLLRAGDKVEGRTLDLSTGGTNFLSLGLMGTLFDA